MNSRRGKKGSITKRIQQIDRIVGEGGSRSKIEFLVSALIEVQKAMQGVCEELMTIATDTDSEYLDNENLRIDTCIAEAKEYLERRKNDPPSTGSLCESWVQKHNAVNDFVLEDDAVSDVTKGFAGMRAGDDTNVETSYGQQQDKSGSSVSQVLKPAHASWPSGLLNHQASSYVPSQPPFTAATSSTQQTVLPHPHGMYGSMYVPDVGCSKTEY